MQSLSKSASCGNVFSVVPSLTRFDYSLLSMCLNKRPDRMQMLIDYSYLQVFVTKKKISKQAKLPKIA